MKRILAAGILAILAGCVNEPDIIDTRPVFRDTSAQIASQTDVTAARMAGEWVIRQTVSGGTGPQRSLSFELGRAGELLLSETAGFCDGDICGELATLYVMLPIGPGRWQSESPSGVLPDDEIWVMWMDFDSRTAAIGTPSGEFGWIMDKNTTGGGDRIAAAREIMDWFGYDTTQLTEVSQ